MAPQRLIRNPALLFATGAACLFAIGGACIFPGTNFAIAFIQEILKAGAWFAACATVYFLLRHRLNQMLGEIHFWITAATVLIGFALPYWLGPKHGHPGVFLFNELEANLRVVLFFLAAQAIFVANLLWMLFEVLLGKKKIDS